MRLRAVFAKNLRFWREKRGLSQEELAHQADIDRTYVSSLEREQYSVSLDTLEKIAEVLDVEPSKLLAR